MPFLAAFLILAPLLPLLAHYAQSPDGAEMISAAVNGGVLHPSGIPLQWWINRIAVFLVPLEPGWVLSGVSWLGSFGTIVSLLFLLRRLQVPLVLSALASLYLVYVPIFTFLTLTPEKYTWLTFFLVLFLDRLAVVVVEENRSWRAYLLLALAVGLALAQHSALVILLPPFLYVVFRPLRESKSMGWLQPVTAVGFAALVTLAFYSSLLLQRSNLPWPDWGQLESFGDVWNHVIRQDYGVVNLYNEPGAGENSVSAPILFFRTLLGWHLAFLLVPLGCWAVWGNSRLRMISGYLWLIFLPGLAILATTKMPSGDLNTVMGYQERYPMLLVPLTAIFWAWGLNFLIERMPTWRKPFLATVALGVLLQAGWSWRQNLYTNNNLVEIYRQQARSELNSNTVFWSGSDFTAFYGIPPNDRQDPSVSFYTRYPVKALFGMDWYRAKTLPGVSPGLAEVFKMNPPPTSVEDLVRRTLALGGDFTLTEPVRFLPHADIMAMAEQTGVLWTLSRRNTSLYTEKIAINATRICAHFESVWKGLPKEGLWFVREYLDAFRYAFLSARDYFQEQKKLADAATAQAVADVLVPGTEPEEWVKKCEPLRRQLR